MNIEYIRCGDDYIPNLKLPEENRPISKCNVITYCLNDIDRQVGGCTGTT